MFQGFNKGFPWAIMQGIINDGDAQIFGGKGAPSEIKDVGEMDLDSFRGIEK